MTAASFAGKRGAVPFYSGVVLCACMSIMPAEPGVIQSSLLTPLLCHAQSIPQKLHFRHSLFSIQRAAFCPMRGIVQRAGARTVDET